MTTEQLWKIGASLRISRETMEPKQLSQLLKLEPTYSYRRGETNAISGHAYNNGYWCHQRWFFSPERVNVAISWIEEFVAEHKQLFCQLLADGYKIYIYIGIHTTTITYGFEIPPMPVLTEIGIKVGVELFWVPRATERSDGDRCAGSP